MKLESQLQRAELQQRSHHSKPVFVRKIETYFHQLPESNHINEIKIDLDAVPISRAELHAEAEI